MGSKADTVYRELRAQITSGDLAAGQHVDEEVTAQALSVSRTPVREALARLAAESLLVPGAKRQMVVVDVRARQEEVLMMRVMLETTAARRACEAAAESDFDQLRLDIARQRRAAAASDVDRFLAQDEEFHRHMAAAAGLPLLSNFLEQLGGFVRLLRFGMATESRHMAVVVEEHSHLVDLLEKRDAKLLPEALERHIRALDRPTGETVEPARR